MLPFLLEIPQDAGLRGLGCFHGGQTWMCAAGMVDEDFTRGIISVPQYHIRLCTT